MGRVYISLVCSTALVVLCGITSTPASAEPKAAVLPGEAFPVTFTAKNTGGTLETVSGKTIHCTAEAASGAIESATLGTASDDITGCKQGEVSCRSENAKGEKDPIETILITNIKGVVIAVLNGAKELEAGVADILTENLKLNCGVIKIEVKGSTVGLVTPINQEISAGGTAKLVSAQEKGKQLSGECVEEKTVCEKLAKEPLLVSLGAKFEGAGTALSGTITFSKMLTISA